ncbi:hypothetical protein VP01_772g9 [Puccinia sorghi]|uniref:Uncharacterized protein n=1 Tax=Puccinia sorghi TaxID=27349 RepID=A0A0L6UCC4_9BASI|nr:hypothetical protein VP01_772g9 [Puccinia sorghi]
MSQPPQQNRRQGKASNYSKVGCNYEQFLVKAPNFGDASSIQMPKSLEAERRPNPSSPVPQIVPYVVGRFKLAQLRDKLQQDVIGRGEPLTVEAQVAAGL